MYQKPEIGEHYIPDYVTAVRKHWRLIAGAVFISLGICFLYLQAAPSYGYTTSVRLVKNDLGLPVLSRDEINLRLKKNIIPKALEKFSAKNAKVDIVRTDGNEILTLRLTARSLKEEEARNLLENIISMLNGEVVGINGKIRILEQQKQELIARDELFEKSDADLRSQLKDLDLKVHSALAKNISNSDLSLILFGFYNNRQSLFEEYATNQNLRFKLQESIIEINEELNKEKVNSEYFVITEPEKYKKNELRILFIFFAAMGLIAGLIFIGCVEYFLALQSAKKKEHS